MHVRFALAIAVMSCFAAVPAMADFRADFAVVKGGQNAEVPGLSRLEMGGGKMRMDAGNVSMLMDTGNGRMTVLMHDKHQYMDMQKMMETAGAAMQTANAALANLPPEQRAMIEERLGGKIPGMGAKMDVSVTPTGTRERVGNFNCQVYRTQVGGEHMEDVCLANVADAGISGADQATLRHTFDEMKSMTEKMSAGMFHSPLRSMPSDKFPVRMTRFDDAGKVIQVVELKSVTTGGVSGGDFAIPSGYTEADIGSLRRR
jgi:Domain of unknown function (DUF4412)